MSKVWLVTGSASGLGRNISEAVLAAGDLLIATAREPRRLDDLVQKHGESIRTASLDVADEETAKATVQVAGAAFGRLDVAPSGVKGCALEPRAMRSAINEFRMRECES